MDKPHAERLKSYYVLSGILRTVRSEFMEKAGAKIPCMQLF